MPPELRLLALGTHLPGDPVENGSLAEGMETSAEALLDSTGIHSRHYAPDGEGPSDLAKRAAETALMASGTAIEDLSLIVFATATPDVFFPGAACYLQNKLGAATTGALDIRAQSVGFLAGLDLALAFTALPCPASAQGAHGARILVAAGEVHSAGLDYSPAGRDLTPRFGDGAAVGIVGHGESGARIAALRWYTDGTLADRFWCEYPASRSHPDRITEEDLAARRHFAKADLGFLASIAQRRLTEVVAAVLEEAQWSVGSLALAIVDYVDPAVAHAATQDMGIDPRRVDVPTQSFGHVMAAGLPLRLAHWQRELAPGDRVILAAAGPGFSWGAVALELG